MDRHDKWMELALREAVKALDNNDIPVGAVIIKDGKILAKGYNQVELLKDSTAHAEMIALTSAFATLEEKWLTGCTMYVTLEPCSMCAGALVLSRIKRLVIGTDDPKTGACGSVYNIAAGGKLNHKVEIIKGIKQKDCKAVLQEFFKRIRKKTVNS